MAVSVFELFKSESALSSHTPSTMLARTPLSNAWKRRTVSPVGANVTFGSLAFTGRGHGTDRRCLLGLAGELPTRSAPTHRRASSSEIRTTSSIRLGGHRHLQILSRNRPALTKETAATRHQRYVVRQAFNKNGRPNCNMIIAPSVAELRRQPRRRTDRISQRRHVPLPLAASTSSSICARTAD